MAARFVKVRYRDWENDRLAAWILNLAAQDGQSPYDAALVRALPEFAVNIDDVGTQQWKPNRIDGGAGLQQAMFGGTGGGFEAFRARIERTVGLRAIGFDPAPELARLQRADPGNYIPDAQGYMVISVTSGSGDFLGTALLYTGIIIVTAGAAGAFAGAAGASEAGAAGAVGASEAATAGEFGLSAEAATAAGADVAGSLGYVETGAAVIGGGAASGAGGVGVSEAATASEYSLSAEAATQAGADVAAGTAGGGLTVSDVVAKATEAATGQAKSAALSTLTGGLKNALQRAFAPSVSKAGQAAPRAVAASPGAGVVLLLAAGAIWAALKG